VLLLTKYTALAASSRYRAYQYRTAFAEAGLDCTYCPLLPDAYLQRTYARNGSRYRRLAWTVPRVLGSMAQRWWQLFREARAFDVVYLQYEVFPYAPLGLDQVLFRRNPRVVVDFDDAVNTRYEYHASRLVRRVLGNKLAMLVRQSRHVTTGNPLLADWAGRFNPNVTVIPTSVDLRRYPFPGPPRSGGRLVIGWIGTPYTQRYLPLLEGALRALRGRHDFEFKVIGAPGFTMAGMDVRAVPWSEAREVAELQACDIGVMPLPDEPFERGKSALKLIQYFAAGLPAVASPVGVNAEIIRDGENGFLAANPDEWAAKLALLLEQPALRERLGRQGRRTAEERFSVQVNGPRLADVLARVARGGGTNRVEGAAPGAGVP
jgi:glycosyltransferase involved in cell wall biosynthesis